MEQPPRYSQVPQIPSVRDLTAAVADRAAIREARVLLTWGVVCLAIGLMGVGDLLGCFLLPLGVGMTLAGLVFKNQKSVGTFIASGIALSIVGLWNFAGVALELLVKGSVGGFGVFFAIFGVLQVAWAYGSFSRGAKFRSILGGWSTAATTDAQNFVAWLAMAPRSPGMVVVKVGSGTAGLPWRAYVGPDFLFALEPNGYGCFALPLADVERAMNGEAVPIPHSSRKMTLPEGEAQLVRELLWDRANA